jgi:hypothetical protein
LEKRSRNLRKQTKEREEALKKETIKQFAKTNAEKKHLEDHVSVVRF